MNELSIDVKTAEDITKSIVSLGSDNKKAFDELERSLTKLREADSETKKYADSLVTEQVRKMSADFEARYTDLGERLKASVADVATKAEARVKEEVERIELALRRGGAGDGEAKALAADTRDAVELKRTQLIRANRLPAGQDVDPAAVDVDAYRAYRKAATTYYRRHEQGMNEEERKALSVGIDPAGGYLVIPAMAGRIITKIWETSPVRQLASVQQIGTDKLVFIVDYDEAGVGWVGEVEARAETSTPTFASIELEAREQYAKPKVSQQLLEDATIDIEAWLAGKVADKMARSEATAFVSGNGVKQPRGFLTYPSGVGYDKIEQIATGNALLLTPDSIVSLPWKLKDAYRRNGQWLLRRSTMPTLVTYKDGQGQYLYSLGLRGQTLGDTLAGYPLNLADDMPDVAAGALPVAFGDWKGYQIIDRLGLTMLRDPYSSKPYTEFYSRRRLGGGVVSGESIKLLVVSA